MLTAYDFPALSYESVQDGQTDRQIVQCHLIADGQADRQTEKRTE